MKTVKTVIAIWVIAALLAWAFGDVSVAGEAGQTTCNFLNIGFGSRANALGQAFTAVSTDASAVYWNPAGLAWSDLRQVQVSHNEWYQDLKLENISLVIPGGSTTFGAGLAYLSYGDIQGYDNFGYATDEISVYSFSASVSVSTRVTEKISLGITGRYVEQSLELAKGRAFAGDIGLMAQLGKVSLGLAATNFGSKVKYINEEEELPRSIRSGLAVMPFGESALISLDVHAPLDGGASIHNGYEFNLDRQLYLRTGLAYHTDLPEGTNALDYSFGLGLKYNSGRFDYTFSPSNITDDTMHSFSIGVSW